MSAMFSSVLVDNPRFTRVSENGQSWYEDREGAAYLVCPRCENIVPEYEIDEYDVCEKCYDLLHTCAYCGKKSKEELKPMPDGEYYCPECTIESQQHRINYVAKRLHALQKRLATEPETIKSEFPHDYVTQSGRAFGTMLGMSTTLAGILAVLEGK